MLSARDRTPFLLDADPVYKMIIEWCAVWMSASATMRIRFESEMAAKDTY
jgi:hypothetical protein